MVGGITSFGAGGWDQTSWDKLIPIDMAGGTIGLALTRTLWTARDLTRLTGKIISTRREADDDYYFEREQVRRDRAMRARRRVRR